MISDSSLPLRMTKQCGDLLTDIDPQNFVIAAIINARVSPRRQCTFVGDRLSVSGRVIKIVDHKILPAYTNMISLAMTVVRLLPNDFDRPLDDLILLVSVRIRQAIDVA